MTRYERNLHQSKMRKRQLRAAMVAQGLSTFTGKPRVNQRHWEIPKHITGYARNLEVERLKARRNSSMGLRTDGKPLVRKRHHLPPATTQEQRRANHRARCRSYIAANLAKGLTWNGKPRFTLSPFELEWRQFRQSLQIQTTRSWSDLTTLSATDL